MPNNPQIRRSDNATTTPGVGDIEFNPSTNSFRMFNGTSWVGLRFNTGVTITGSGLDVTGGITLTTGGIVTSTGYASTNATTGPRFEIPAVGGPPTGVVTTTSTAANIAYDTVTRAIVVRSGGSWFTTASLNLL